MAILIEGIELPKDCPMCPMAHWDRFDTFKGCEITPGKRFAMIKDKEYAESSTRPDWCPLIEVPEPHGRLGDLDALKDLYHYNTHDSDIDKAWTCNIRRSLDNAPTIIPASEEVE